MRSTSAAEASAMRLRWSTKPVALSNPGRSVCVSIGFNLLPIAMMAQPCCGKTFASFLLEHCIDQPVILGIVARDAVEDKAAEREREGPLPHFPQFIIGITLRAHDGNLVNRRLFQADLAINGSNRGFARLRVGQIKAHR